MRKVIMFTFLKLKFNSKLCENLTSIFNKWLNFVKVKKEISICIAKSVANILVETLMGRQVQADGIVTYQSSLVENIRVFRYNVHCQLVAEIRIKLRELELVSDFVEEISTGWDVEKNNSNHLFFVNCILLPFHFNVLHFLHLFLLFDFVWFF